MNLRFRKGELTPEQEMLIQQAGQKTGVAVEMRDGDLSIQNLTDRQFYTLVFATQEQWGLPFNSVRCIPVTEAEAEADEVSEQKVPLRN